MPKPVESALSKPKADPLSATPLRGLLFDKDSALDAYLIDLTWSLLRAWGVVPPFRTPLFDPLIRCFALSSSK
jgi:hypothetical protein